MLVAAVRLAEVAVLNGRANPSWQIPSAPMAQPVALEEDEELGIVAR